MHAVIFVSHFTEEHSEGLAVYKNSEGFQPLWSKSILKSLIGARGGGILDIYIFPCFAFFGEYFFIKKTALEGEQNRKKSFQN